MRSIQFENDFENDFKNESRIKFGSVFLTEDPLRNLLFQSFCKIDWAMKQICGHSSDFFEDTVLTLDSEAAKKFLSIFENKVTVTSCCFQQV